MKARPSFTAKLLSALVITTLALAVLPLQPAQADHGFDTKVRFTGATNPLTSAYTVGATGTLLVLSIVTDGTTSRGTGAPTYNGIAMTQAGSTQVTFQWGGADRAVVSPEPAHGIVSHDQHPQQRKLETCSQLPRPTAPRPVSHPLWTSPTGATATAPPTRRCPLRQPRTADVIVAALGDGNTQRPELSNRRPRFLHGRRHRQWPVRASSNIRYSSNGLDGVLSVVRLRKLPATTVGDGTSPSSKPVKGSYTNQAVSAFTLSTNIGTDTVTQLVVTGGGTGIADVDTNGVKLWQDNGSVRKRMGRHRYAGRLWRLVLWEHRHVQWS